MLVPLLASAACAVPPTAQPRADRAHYTLDVRVSPTLREVTGSVYVRFTASRPTDRLVFRLWPNGFRQRREGMRLDVGRPSSPDSDIRAERPDPTTLVVRVRGGLSTGGTVHVYVPWRLRVPAARLDRISRFRGGVRLGSFFPILSWDPHRGWVTDPLARILGESSTTPAADFEVRMHMPRGTSALVSGVPTGKGRWRADAVRDVAVAVAPFRIVTATAHAPQAVTVRVGVPRGTEADAHTFARYAVRALERLSRKYGPYRWPRYTLVDAPDLVAGGIEYPTLSFIGGSSYLRAVIDHETAHQWFYSLVGNDQARDPWLDETLATWSQQRIDGLIRPPRRNLPAGARRHVGAPMSYWTRYPHAYFWGVYEGGANALRSLGNDDAVDCALRAYAAREAYAIAQPGDLLDELNRVIPGAQHRLRAWGIHR